jgi:hypothetical protein
MMVKDAKRYIENIVNISLKYISYFNFNFEPGFIENRGKKDIGKCCKIFIKFFRDDKGIKKDIMDTKNINVLRGEIKLNLIL